MQRRHHLRPLPDRTADPLDRSNLPGPGLPVSNRSSPFRQVLISPNRRIRAISWFVSVGNVCS